MNIKHLCLFILFFPGQELSAQEKIKFRFGINSVHAASYYYLSYVGATDYYTYRKIPLTNFDKPVFSIPHGQNLFNAQFNRTLTFNFSVEKRISDRNILSLGIVLNDNIGMGVIITTQNSNSTYNGYKYITPSDTNLVTGINSRRYSLALHHLLNNNVSTSTKRKINLKTEICIGVNLLQALRTALDTTSYTNITATGDTINITNRVFAGDKKWGFTLVGGFNFKIYNTAKNTEIVCLSISYEQALIGMRNVPLVGMQTEFYVANGPKKLSYGEYIFSRGSRLNITLSRAFSLSQFKKNKKKE